MNQSLRTTCRLAVLLLSLFVSMRNVQAQTPVYCSSSSMFVYDEEIYNVTAGTLNNNSNCSTVAPGAGSIMNCYSDYTSGASIPAAPVFMQGATINTSITVSTCGSFNYTSGAAIFIDYNMDGDFADPGEQVWNNGSFADINCLPQTIVPGSFTVPLSATPGTTVMRVIDAEGYAGNTITPCLTYGYGETEDYLVTIAAAVACSGTPSVGAASAAPASVCPNGTTVVSLPSLAPATGYSYQWQSSPDGITWTNIPSATGDNYTAMLTDTTYFQCIVTCTNSGLSDTSIPVMVPVSMGIGCYCTSYATTYYDEEIYNFTVSNLNNASNCSSIGTGAGSIQNQYSDYTSGPGAPAAAQLTQGYSYNDTIMVSTCGITNYMSGAAIFIDYNQDGDFDDPGEGVWNNGSSADINCLPATLVPGNFIVPLTALTGTTYMRVIDAEFTPGNSITPCLNTYGYGETEDYLVNILPAPPIDMGATVLVGPSSSGCHTANETVAVTIHNYSNLTIDFSTDPVTVNASVTGPNPATFAPVVINTGTLTSGSDLNVTITTTYNMTAAGTYVFSASSSVVGDGMPGNDAMPVVTIILSGGVSIASPSTICSGSSTDLSVSGQTNGGSVQWESSPDGITWTPIAGATTNPYSVLPAAATMYYHAVICGSLVSTTDTVTTISVLPATGTNGTRCGPGAVALSAAGTDSIYWYTQPTGGSAVHVGNSYAPFVTATDTFYAENVFTYCGTGSATPVAATCYPTYGNACSSADYIDNFYTTGGTTNISNLGSGCNGSGPSNSTFFPGQIVTMYPGGTFGIAVQSGSSWGEGHHIWIDYNNDGDFTDPGEDVWSSPTASMALYTGSITVPPGTTAGPKRIRVMCIYASVPAGTDVCSPFLSFGEVEEYTLNVCTQCASTRVPVVATVTPPPVMTITAANASLCGSDTTILSVSSPNNGYGYTWSPAAALNSTSGDSVMWMPTTPGSYTYTVNAMDAVSGCTNIDSITVMMSTAPVITATASDSSVCRGATINLNANTPPAVAQISNFNALNTSTTYPAPYGNWYGGSRHQMLILASEMTAAGLSAGNISGMTFQVTNTNASAPLMNFTISMGSTSVTSLTTTFETSPMTTVYTNASYAPTVGTNTHLFSTPFYWDGTSNVIIETCFINQTGPSSTSYTNNCTMRQVNTTFASTNVYYADNDLNACSAANGWTTYNRRPNIGLLRSFGSWTYAWTPGASVSNAAIQNTTAMMMSSTAFTVVATDTVSGCTGTSNVMVNVLPTPSPNLGSDTTICSNTPITLDGSAGNYTYLWQDNSTAQTLIANATGTYNVLVTDTANGCAASDTAMITVNTAPSFTLGADVTVCAGTNVTFTGPSGTYTYLWNTGDNTMSVNENTAGTYDLTVTDANNCFAMDTVMLFTNPLPVVALGSDTAICSANAPFVLSAPAGNYSYLWNDNSTGQTLNAGSTGTYDVMVTDNTTSCANGDTIAVTVNPSPNVFLGNDTTFCNSDGPITLMAPAGPFDYLWVDNSTGNTFATNTTGTYWLMATDSVNGCSTTDLIQITVNPSPATILNDTTLCGATYTAQASTGSGYTYLWNDNTTGSSIPVNSPGGLVWVMITDGTTGCAVTDSAMITINTPPVVTLNLPSSACTTDAPFVMNGTPAGGTYSGPGVAGNFFNPNATGTGSFTVTYYYSDPNGCSDSTTDVITVSACVGVDEHSLADGMSVFPNPNNGLFTFAVSNANYNELTMEITTVDGKIIYSDKASDLKGNYLHPIDLSAYANGVYFLSVKADGQTYVQKIVMEK